MQPVVPCHPPSGDPDIDIGYRVIRAIGVTTPEIFAGDRQLCDRRRICRRGGRISDCSLNCRRDRELQACQLQLAPLKLLPL